MSNTDLNTTTTVPGAYETKTWSYPSSEPTNWTRYNRNHGGGTRIRQGVTTPNYYLRRKTGQLPHNPFSYYEENYTLPYGWKYEKYDPFANGVNIQHTRARGTFSQVKLEPPGSYSALLKSNQLNVAKQKVLLKLKDQKINLAQAYAERGQTLALLTDIVGRLGRAAAAMRHGDTVGAAAALGVPGPSGRIPKRGSSSERLASNWLAFQYGVRPLLGDVYGALEHLRTRTLQNTKPLRVSSESGANTSWSTSSKDQSMVTTEEYEVKVQCKCTIYYALISAELHELSQLGITNPVLLSWELTKFSFVVDWLLNVSAWLNSFDAASGYNFYEGSTTTYEKRRRQQTVHCNGPYGYRTTLQQYTVGSTDVVSVKRDKLTSFPIMTLPAFRDPSSLEHFLNAVALLTTLKR